MDWYKRYLGDYRKKTGRLSVLEHGIYNLLLDEYYASEEPLPAERVEIYRFLPAVTAEEQAATDKVLDKYWIPSGGGLINERAAEEIENRHAQGKVNKRIAVDREEKKRQKQTNRDEKEHEPLHETATYTRVQSPDSKDSKTPVKPDKLPSGLTGRIFAYWQKALNHPLSKLSDKRRRRITQAFKAGFTEDDMKLAIDGCVATPYNMGQNPYGQMYDDLELILRDVEHIERFMTNAVPVGSRPNPEADARVERVRLASIAKAEADLDELNRRTKNRA